MFGKTKFLLPAALFGTMPFLAMAGGLGPQEIEQFKTATLTVTAAGETALKTHPGTLAGVSFEDEDGRAAYEAVIVDAEGNSWTVMIDAKNGQVFASGLSSMFGDGDHDGDHDGGDRKGHHDGHRNGSDDDHDGDHGGGDGDGDHDGDHADAGAAIVPPAGETAPDNVGN